jgi:hypothetical protein
VSVGVKVWANNDYITRVDIFNNDGTRMSSGYAGGVLVGEFILSSGDYYFNEIQAAYDGKGIQAIKLCYNDGSDIDHCSDLYTAWSVDSSVELNQMVSLSSPMVSISGLVENQRLTALCPQLNVQVQE